MNTIITKLDIIGILFTAISGTLLHFAYDTLGKPYLLGYLAPISESVFEHLKLLYTPFLIYTIFQYFILHNKTGTFILSRAIGLWIGLLFIPVSFYLYTALLNKDFLAVDILIFLCSVIISFLAGGILQKKLSPGLFTNLAGLFLLLLPLYFFINYTYTPLNYPIFKEPKQ